MEKRLAMTFSFHTFSRWSEMRERMGKCEGQTREEPQWTESLTFTFFLACMTDKRAWIREKIRVREWTKGE